MDHFSGLYACLPPRPTCIPVKQVRANYSVIQMMRLLNSLEEVTLVTAHTSFPVSQPAGTVAAATPHALSHVGPHRAPRPGVWYHIRRGCGGEPAIRGTEFLAEVRGGSLREGELSVRAEASLTA